MNIAANSGDFSFESLKDIIDFILKASKKPFDDIWIYGENKYPCLVISVNSAHSVLHYFKDEDGDMWQSKGNYDKDTEFVMCGEKTVMPCDTVIPLEIAIQCVKEFWTNYNKPCSIKWQAI